MNDYLFLMHQMPHSSANSEEDWERYLTWLRGTGQFAGGSAIGGGICVSQSGTTEEVSSHLSGYIRVTAGSIEEARKLLRGNPVIDGGGTVEIRELPKGAGTC